jgi:hypothetical protein
MLLTCMIFGKLQRMHKRIKKRIHRMMQKSAHESPRNFKVSKNLVVASHATLNDTTSQTN